MKDLFLEANGSPCIVTVCDDYGEAVVRGRTWRWEWHNYCGPLFVNADGSDRKRIPSENHPVWKAIEKWERKRERKQKAKEIKP